MKLAWPFLQDTLEWTDGGIWTLVLENKPLLRQLLEAVRSQSTGGDGDLVLSEKQQILDFSKTVELVTDPFSLPFTAKKLLSRLTQSAAEAAEPYGEELLSIVTQLNALASKICMGMEYNLTWNELDSFDELLKLMAVHPDEEDMSLPERILEYCQLARGLLGKKLVVCYGLHACLSEEEFELLCKEAVYRKFCLLLIEAAQPPRALDEKMIVIDRDLCML